MLPFYNKGEDLHSSYFVGGELNAAAAAIESNRVIPALGRMFQRASDQREDRRTRIDIEELLQGIDYAPDLDQALSAMSAIASLKAQYQLLHTKAGRLWKWGAGHLALTPLTAFAMSMKRLEEALSSLAAIRVSQMESWPWFCVGFLMLWFFSLGMMLFQWIRFRSQMDEFRRSIEDAQSQVAAS